MAPFSLPGGCKRLVETEQGHLTSRNSLIGRVIDETKGCTDGGKLSHQFETTYRQRTATFGGKVTVTHDGKSNNTASNGRKGDDGGRNNNQDDKGVTDANNGKGGKKWCGKFNIFCRGNRTSGNDKKKDGDASDKEMEKEEDNQDDRLDSSSRPTNIPEVTTMISPTPGQMSLFLVSGSPQVPTPSDPLELSTTSMGARVSVEAPLSSSTSYVPQSAYSDQAISASEPIATMIAGIDGFASPNQLIYPSTTIDVYSSTSTKVHSTTATKARTTISPTASTTSFSTVVSPTPSGVSDARGPYNSTGNIGNDPQTAKNNGIEATGGTLNKTGERVLVSVGSIGGFVLLCFLILMVRKAIRNAAQTQLKETGGTRGGILSGLLPRTNIFKRREWGSLNDSSRALNQPSPTSQMSETVANSERAGSLSSYKKVDDLQEGHQPQAPSIQIQFQQPNPIHQHCGSPLPYTAFANVTYPANIAGTRNLASPTMSSHQPQQLGTSTNTSRNGSLATTLVSSSARQVQYVSHHDPNYMLSPCSTFQQGRGGHRMSDISSLSSGFGDGDFIMPIQQQTTLQQTTLQQPQSIAIVAGDYPIPPIPHSNNSNRNTNRFSGISSIRRGGSQSRRDTLYTESSEDTPARFRSLNSWVAQQSGRVKRGRERGGEDEAEYLASLPQLPCQPGVPGIHNPPVEQRFDLMRDDEKPRPVEEIIVRMR
ncbi:hypothetical protein B0T20DRAFT_196677 [Sordaria brevicollis]|uniref:Uncharacterized protein n=1 Tax=Sordaria brevicollis TaxID=83679 RepID=A0AAE0PGD3_SORBR|nr:hypothetical protein B0T20DRAFT_196677 [Sordaria brevicollis]